MGHIHSSGDTYIIVILAASPRRACGGRRTFGFAERFAAPQWPSAVGVLVLVPRGGSTSLRRAITQALRARTKSSPTASKTFGLRPNGNPPSAGNNTGASRLTTGASHPHKELAYGEQNLRPAEWKPA